MAEQPERQENRVEPDAAESAENGNEQLATSPEDAVPDPLPSDVEGLDVPEELTDILDDSDGFDEIDLFDEGVLDDIDSAEESASDAKEDLSGSSDPAPDSSVDNEVEQASPSEGVESKEKDSVEEPAQRADDQQDSDEGKEVSPGEPDAAQSASEEEDADFSQAEEILAGLDDTNEEPPAPSQSSDSATQSPTESSSGEVSSQGVAEDAGIGGDVSPDTVDISLEVEEKESDAASSPDPEKTQESDQLQEDAPGETSNVETGDTDAFGDDLGISLSDDELWDDSADDDIPLFDDEQEEPVAYGPGAQEPLKDDAPTDSGPVEQAEGTLSTPDSETSNAHHEDVKPEEDEPTALLQEEGAESGDVDDVDMTVVSLSLPEWIPYFISGVATMLLFGGVFVLWGMISTGPVTANTASVKSIDVTAQDGHLAAPSASDIDESHVAEKNRPDVKGDATPVQDVGPISGAQSAETFNLAPFIIPVMRQGELVFFKLTVELIVPDMKTKQELKKREAWVRDAIYTELKGIEVGPGTKGEFLLNYRRPLKKRIEKELAPLEIRDVRLMGYVLK